MFKLTMNKMQPATSLSCLRSVCQSLLPPHLPDHTSSQGAPGDLSFLDPGPSSSSLGKLLSKTRVTSIWRVGGHQRISQATGLNWASFQGPGLEGRQAQKTLASLWQGLSTLVVRQILQRTLEKILMPRTHPTSAPHHHPLTPKIVQEG